VLPGNDNPLEMGFPTVGILNTPTDMYVFKEPQNQDFYDKKGTLFSPCGLPLGNSIDLSGGPLGAVIGVSQVSQGSGRWGQNGRMARVPQSENIGLIVSQSVLNEIKHLWGQGKTGEMRVIGGSSILSVECSWNVSWARSRGTGNGQKWITA